MKLNERTDSKTGVLKEVINIGSNTHTRIAENPVAYLYYNRLYDSWEVFLKEIYTSSSEFSGQIEGHEKFPSNESFGVWAWSYTNKEQALLRLERLYGSV